MARRLLSPRTGAALALAALTLAGCAATPPEPTDTEAAPTEAATPEPTTASTPTPTPTPTPSEPTEEELIEQARDAWEAYQVRTAEVMADPASSTPEGLIDVATAEFAAEVHTVMLSVAEQGAHGEGRLTTTAFEPIDLEGLPETMTAAVCTDYTQHQWVNDAGQVAAEGQPQLGSFVTFQRTDDGERFVVAFDDAEAEGAAAACG